jgi:hypothetical protein
MPVVRTALAGDDTGGLHAKLQQFEALPGIKSFRIDVGSETVASERAGVQLFVASAIKTFIVAQYLRDVEAGRLPEDEQLPVDDSVRQLDSVSRSRAMATFTGSTRAMSNSTGSNARRQAEPTGRRRYRRRESILRPPSRSGRLSATPRIGTGNSSGKTTATPRGK